MARGDASAASGGGFRVIGASSARTSFSLGLVSLRSASKVRAESVRSGPCEAKIGEANLVSNTRVSGHPRKKRSDVFSEFRVVRATASAAMRERQRESNEGMGRYAGEDTHLGEERLRDVDVAEVDGGENLGAMEKETKRRQSIGS